MEKPLFRDVLLPLEEITLRRVIISLWIETLNSNWSLRYNFDLIGDRIRSKISHILPTLLKKRMIPLVRLVGSEILDWQTFHGKNLPDVHDDFNFLSLKQLQWTQVGSIDYQKTAEKLINLKMFDAKKRYGLACLYCLEDYIPLLWEEISEEYKNNLKEQFYFSVDMQMRFYWTYLLKGEEYKFSCVFKTRLPQEVSFYQFAFKLVAVRGNKAASRYFFQKLSNEEQQSSLFYTISSVLSKRFGYSHETKFYDFPKQNLSDVICYLMSLMSPEQQMLALRNCPCTILACFLDRPTNDLFLELSDVIWTFLPDVMYDDLLCCMYQIINSSGYYNPELFKDFFRQSPGSFRKEFVRKESRLYGCFFPDFFGMLDSETIEVILRNIEPEDRLYLVFSKNFYRLMCNSIFKGNWHIVEVCIREAMLSKEGKQKLKAEFFKFMSKTHKELGVEDKTRKRKRFCEFLDDPSSSIAAGEESSKNETLTEVKKLCSEEEKNVLPKN